MLLRNMSTNFFVNSGNVGVNTPPRHQQIDTKDIIHPQDISANSVASSSTKSVCWRHILMFTLKGGMHVLIQNVIASVNHQQSIRGISRDVVHQGNHQHAMNVESLLRKKKYLDEHMKIHSYELPEECPHCGKKYRWRSSVLIHIRTKHPDLAKPVYNQVHLVLHCMFVHTQFFFQLNFFQLCTNMMCTTRLAWQDTSCLYTIIFLQFSDVNIYELGCFVPLCCLCYLKGFKCTCT